MLNINDLGIWSGGGEDSWYNYDKLQGYRTIKNPEWKERAKGDTNFFYLLSVDVGRFKDQSACSIFRVNIRENGKFYSTLVNMVVIGRTSEKKTFVEQAMDIKKIIALYNVQEAVIDINGLGVGLADEMIREQVDSKGIVWPAYGFNNDKEYAKIQPAGARQILYGIKASGPLNSKIHGNAYSRIHSGMVRFLIHENKAKSALMATKVGQKMTLQKRVARLMPHEMTTSLFEEMANLRLKKTGSSQDIILEQINSRFPKDKYSSLAYGLWRIKELEEKNYERFTRRRGGRQLIFYTKGRR